MKHKEKSNAINCPGTDRNAANGRKSEEEAVPSPGNRFKILKRLRGIYSRAAHQEFPGVGGTQSATGKQAPENPGGFPHFLLHTSRFILLL